MPAVSAMSIRIVFVIPNLDRTGTAKQLALLASRLPRDDFDVRVCALERGGACQKELDDAGVPVTVIGRRRAFDPAALWRLGRVIKEVQPDIAHTWLFSGNSYGRWAARRNGAKHIVASERCVDRWKTWGHLAVDRYLARSTDRIVVNSPAVRQFYVGKGLAADKFEVIANGVEVRVAEPALSREAFLKRLDLPEDARVIAVIGSLCLDKQLKDAIWATDLLKRARDDAHLVIIGDGPLRWRLTRYRDQIEIAERVHFLGVRDDVPELMPHFDCLWLASRCEGQSNAIIEAMAAGVPVVASDIPANRELVESGETGYLFPLGDRAHLAQWTNVLLDDPDLAKRIGSAGQAKMREQFTVERMVDSHAKLYRELVDG
jgi:glycosyltransferase involved in cell wall biosynthesis